jgi:hypothetical protein
VPHRVQTADPGDLAERLAIQQWDARLPRHWADGIERILIDQIGRPRRGFSSQRWRRLIDDLLALHEAGWLRQLAALGWGATDVFGCHAHAPLARLDCAGLLLLLDGRSIMAVTANAASLRTSSGAVQTRYRKPMRDKVVPLWEMPAET